MAKKSIMTSCAVSGTPQALADCRLAGDFYTAGLLTEGSWKVTFRLEGGE